VLFRSTALEKNAALEFEDFLLSPEIQRQAAQRGLRPANLEVDIKCKASGEVIKLPFDISDAVKKGELLVELDPIDEERRVKLAEADLAAQHFRQHERIEGQQQPVVRGKFVAEGEPHRDELRWLAPLSWWNPLHRVNAGFQILRAGHEVHGQPPLGRLQVFRAGRADDAFV
jgi:hypothetical protein